MDSRGLRGSKRFGMMKDGNLSRFTRISPGHDLKPMIYEGIASFLLIGIDEWFWTVYCLVDVFFKKDDQDRESARTYFTSELDAPLGNSCECQFPVWNPRQYLLRALRVRVRQITREWRNTAHAIQDILGSEVSIYVTVPNFLGNNTL